MRSRKSAEFALVPKPLSGWAQNVPSPLSIAAEKPGITWPAHGPVRPFAGRPAHPTPGRARGGRRRGSRGRRASARTPGRRATARCPRTAVAGGHGGCGDEDGGRGGRCDGQCEDARQCAAHEDSAHAREPIDADRRDDVRTWNRSGRPGEHLRPHASRARATGTRRSTGTNVPLLLRCST